jgi:hypothetical protein
MAELRIPRGRVKLPGGGFGPSSAAIGDFGIVRQPPAVADRIEAPERRRDTAQVMGSFKRGGKAKCTGVYRLHKGEKVVTAAKQATAARKRLENIGKKTTPRQAATPQRMAKPIARKPAPRR